MTRVRLCCHQLTRLVRFEVKATPNNLIVCGFQEDAEEVTGKPTTAALVVLVGYQTLDIRRHPLEPLPMPMNRHTGQPQRPNGEVITVGAG